MTTLESLLSQVAQLAGTADLSLRYSLSNQLQRLSRSIATPRQIMQQHAYPYTEYVAARVAADLGLFEMLSESEHPLKTEEIASRCGIDPAVIDRILRHLAATYTIAEVGESTFAANETTRLLASAAGKGSIMWGFNVLSKSFLEFPDFLKATKYKYPDDTMNTAFHRAYDTKLQFFRWVQENEEDIRYFHPHLTTFEGPVKWPTVIPWNEKLRDRDSNVPLFVDIGGGHGYQCAAFRKATVNHFPGRVVNQDLAPTLAEAPEYDDIEMVAQDFYEKQQIQGASIYYMRMVLHDLPDKQAKQILQRTRDAMAPESILLIDELVMPEKGASHFATQLDITMMTLFASMERTLPHWRSLLGEVGLEIREVYKYDPEVEWSILEAVPIKSSQ